ncbi:hypothetical protein AN931_23075 [Mycobacterium intracellulare subsp. chimaera]|nr:hypothetical protein AN931_23075 [Mycobacterium intracellulare subsp. chimaera]KPN48998.1 hypothetical protein AN933_22765 [Mycobacterium intracellulare subsp. chimaera]
MPTLIYSQQHRLDHDWNAQSRYATEAEDARVKRTRLYSPVFFAVMAALFVALFVVNVIHGTWLGLISTGGLAVLMGYRAWSGKRRTNQQ